MATADTVRWPLKCLNIAPVVNNDAVNFSFRSSDPAVVCDFAHVIDDDDPIEVAVMYKAIVAAGTAATSNSCYPLANQGGTYLNLFYADNATIAGGAKVRAFGGYVIKNNSGPPHRFRESDLDASAYNTVNDSLLTPTGMAGIIWLPLYHPVTGDHLQTFPTSKAEVKATGAVGTVQYLGGVTYFCRGADIIMVLPVNDDTGTSNNPVCLGMFGC